MAASLWSAGFATLEVRLAAPGQSGGGIEAAAADRALAVLEAARRVPPLKTLNAGLFVTGPDAASVLTGAAARPDVVDSIVAELPDGTLACVDKGFLTVLGKHADARRSGRDGLCREGELVTKWFRDALACDPMH